MCPPKTVTKSHDKSFCVDDFDRDAIRRNIHRMYEEKKHLTLTIILHALKEDDLFAGGRASLAKLLKDMGFGYKKVNNKRYPSVMYCTYPKIYICTCRYYFEQPRIIEQRHNYLRRMRLNRQDKRPVVYLDETWANAHDGKDKAWVEKDDITGGTIGGIQRPSGKGSRLIIIHAGSENGWVPNCS